MNAANYKSSVILCSICFSMLLCGSARADSPKKTRFIVMTGDKKGFKDGDSVYELGMKSDEFIRKFGDPDKKTDDGMLCYLGEGIQVSTENGTVKSFCFYTAGFDWPERDLHFKPADTATDNGVHAGMTYREVTKLIGSPTKKSDAGDLIGAEYPWGFLDSQNGDLVSISISTHHAEPRK